MSVRNNSWIRWQAEMPASCSAFFMFKEENMKETKTFTEGKILKTAGFICVAGAAGLVSAGHVRRSGSSGCGKICFFCGCIGGVHRLSADGDHHKPDQQLRYGNDNSSGAADRKRQAKRGRRDDRNGHGAFWYHRSDDDRADPHFCAAALPDYERAGGGLR